MERHLLGVIETQILAKAKLTPKGEELGLEEVQALVEAQLTPANDIIQVVTAAISSLVEDIYEPVALNGVLNACRTQLRLAHEHLAEIYNYT